MATSIEGFIAADRHIPTSVSRLLRGDHGIGKSAVIAQIAEARGLPFIDRRLSQFTEGDIVGLPVLEGEVTRFKPVDWIVRACKEPCVLFLDEMNRATSEVMQSAFQLVLDRSLNGNVLHEGTVVYAAVNTGTKYSVNDIDPALLDRFAVFDLQPKPSETIAHFRRKGMSSAFIEYLEKNPEHLDPPKAARPGEKTPSRRSWERLYQALVQPHGQRPLLEQPSSDLFYQVASSMIGPTVTALLSAHLKSENPVTVDDILKSYGDPDSDIRARVKKMSNDRWINIIDAFGGWVIQHNRDKLEGGQWPFKDCETEEEALSAAGFKIDDPESIYKLIPKSVPLTEVNNFSLFFRDIPPTLRVYTWRTMITSTPVLETDDTQQKKTKKQNMVVSFHWGIKEAMCMAYGVRSGKRGIGMKPTIIQMHGVENPTLWHTDPESCSNIYGIGAMMVGVGLSGISSDWYLGGPVATFWSV